MNWGNFLKRVGKLPVIDAELLLAGKPETASLKVQLCRWQKSGKLIQVRRGIYVLAEPYRKLDIFEPYLASLLKKPSYVSAEKALEYHGLIPEAVPVYTSVTTKRPEKIVSSLGIFDFRHIKKTFFWGYNSVTVNKQTGFIASPEKALLDFFYLKGLKISPAYLEELRLENTEKLDLEKLVLYAKKFKKPGVLRVARMLKKHIISLKAKEKKL